MKKHYLLEKMDPESNSFEIVDSFNNNEKELNNFIQRFQHGAILSNTSPIPVPEPVKEEFYTPRVNPREEFHKRQKELADEKAALEKAEEIDKADMKKVTKIRDDDEIRSDEELDYVAEVYRYPINYKVVDANGKTILYELDTSRIPPENVQYVKNKFPDYPLVYTNKNNKNINEPPPVKNINEPPPAILFDAKTFKGIGSFFEDNTVGKLMKQRIEYERHTKKHAKIAETEEEKFMNLDYSINTIHDIYLRRNEFKDANALTFRNFANLNVRLRMMEFINLTNFNPNVFNYDDVLFFKNSDEEHMLFEDENRVLGFSKNRIHPTEITKFWNSYKKLMVNDTGINFTFNSVPTGNSEHFMGYYSASNAKIRIGQTPDIVDEIEYNKSKVLNFENEDLIFNIQPRKCKLHNINSKNIRTTYNSKYNSHRYTVDINCCKGIYSSIEFPFMKNISYIISPYTNYYIDDNLEFESHTIYDFSECLIDGKEVDWDLQHIDKNYGLIPFLTSKALNPKIFHEKDNLINYKITGTIEKSILVNKLIYRYTVKVRNISFDSVMETSETIQQFYNNQPFYKKYKNAFDPECIFETPLSYVDNTDNDSTIYEEESSINKAIRMVNRSFTISKIHSELYSSLVNMYRKFKKYDHNQFNIVSFHHDEKCDYSRNAKYVEKNSSYNYMKNIFL